MAKQIKAIKCPQCGSSLHTKLGEDHYTCNNCNTEYFLDNDDININVKHSSNIDANTVKIIKKIGVGILIIVAVSIVVSTCNNLFRKDNNRDYGGYSSSKSETKDKKQKEFYISYYFTDIYETDNNRIIAFSIYKRGYKDYNDRVLDSYYLEFRDLFTNKVYNQEKIDTKDFNRITDVLGLKNGELYFIENKRKLYYVNKQSFSIEDVTDKLIVSKHAEFSSGIAELNLNINDGDSFGVKIMTNLGKEIFYYPAVDKMYMSSNDHWNARNKKSTLFSNTTEKNYFVFTKKSTDFKDQPIQLIKAVYKSNNGGPEDLPLPEWVKDYANGRSGIFIVNEKTPYIKRLFSKDSRILSFIDLTPDRLYFDPKVVFYDDSDVVIKYRPTIAEDAVFILQCLNANNGEVNWTLNLPEEMKNVSRVVKTSQGYITQQRDEKVILIDQTGQISKDLTLPKEGKEE